MLMSWLIGLGLFCFVEADVWDKDGVQGASEDFHSLERNKRLHRNDSGFEFWPKAVMPYTIDEEAMPMKAEYERVIAMYEAMTCVRLPYWNESTPEIYGLKHNGYMRLVKREGCWSGSLGHSYTVISVSCCDGLPCVHEIGHTLGLYHEQENPMRDGWIRANWNNVLPESKSAYEKQPATHWDNTQPHDISSPLHYRPWMYATRSGSVSVLFPELSIREELYYVLGEVSHMYHCDTFPPCHGKNLNCENDGYQTVVRGKCACSCPTGLDPDNACKTPLRKVTSASWPKGQYALPKLLTGCLNGGSFQDGKLIHTGADGNTMSDSSHVMGEVRGSRAELNFCTRTIADDVFYTEDDAKFNWPLGNYCTYMKGDSCPTGFGPHSIKYTVSSLMTTGQVPDGNYGNTAVEMRMCCQYQGFAEEPTSFPTDKPFALIKLGSTCQAVKGMRVDSESFTIESLDKINTTLTDWLGNGNMSFTVPVCHYQALDMDCGRTIQLSKSDPEVTIEMSSNGRTDLECTWLIKGDNKETTLVFDFEDFNGAKDGKDCIDRVEVRHSRIGQFGLKYCGEKPDHSIRSITDKLLVRFFSKGSSESSFKARIRLTEFADMCYDPVDKRGASYDGTVNYTRTFKPCLPWAQMSECYHHPYLDEDMFASLDGNACRNPDNSFRPWCYTDKDECQRDYCDVCGIEVPHDKVDYCDKLKDKGFCTTDGSSAVQYCPKTCFDQLPSSKTPAKKYTEITCGQPTPPSDGNIVGEIKSSYDLGETVQYKCNRGPSVVTSKCMTSGRWSELLSACLECPIGFTVIDNKCYRLMDEGDTRFYLPELLKDSYEKALAICKTMEGTLAAPRSQLAASAITALASSRSSLLGIHKIEEGTCVYSDGTELTWTNWGKNVNPDASSSACVVADKTTKWKTTWCRFKKYFVCEIPALELTCTDVHAKCKDLLTDNPTLCEDVPEFARKFCRRTCNICQDDDATCSVQNSNPNVLTMTTKQSISVGESVNYDCLRFTYPTKGDKHQACLPGGVLSGKPLQCDECPFGFKTVKNACRGLLGGRALSFKDAREECRKIGGLVAMPKNQEENEAVGSLSLGEMTWVGLTDGEDEGTFVWDDMSSLGWKNWATGEPKANGDSLDCTMMNKDKLWINVNCDDYRLSTVCTLPKTGSSACYDVRDKGFTYNGKAHVTVRRDVCGNWMDKGHCSHNSPFVKGKERYNLDGNFCRNPDDSERPWCYTNGCIWHYCDVCDGRSQPDYNVRDDWKSYTGTAHITENGEVCGHWADKKGCHVNPSNDRYTGLNFEKNYCRNHDNSAAPWCYTTGCHWNYCDMSLGHPLNNTNVVDIRCSPPSIPDGEIVGIPRPSYRLGDEVTVKCKRNKFRVTTTCLTSGDWLPIGSVCTECPLGYRRFGDTCYGSVNKELDYDDAVKECGKIGGHLPRPKTLEENEFIKNITKDKNNWIDARSFPDDNYNTFKWSDGTTFNWLKGEPSKFHCAYINKDGDWDSTDCEFVLQDQVVICAVHRLDNIECKDFLETQCTQLLTDRPSMCEDDIEFAKEYCRKTCGVCVHVGGRCRIDRSDKKIHIPEDFAYIGVGQFLNFHCKEGFFQSTGGNNLRACLPSGDLTGSAITCQQCPMGYVSRNKLCYRLVDNVFTFNGAAAKCKEMNGFIASPRDEAENDFIDSIRKGRDVWLGASDAKARGNFRWQDETKVEYSNWSPGEPNDDENEGCVAMTSNKRWEGQSCDEFTTNRVVCIVPFREEETCYDIEDKGATYDGQVSVTDTSQTCIPWATATRCPHNPFVKGDEQKNLVENYCRNPDNSQGPWCYVDADMCDKKYCNVCESEPDAHFISVRCKTPMIPEDGEVRPENLAKEYKVGDKLDIACSRNVGGVVASTTCLTSGHWSPLGMACIECPMGYEVFNGQCYKLVNQQLNFKDAHGYCDRMVGGHIASPKTQAENDFVYSLSPDKDIWIGANDIESEGKWMWEDGSEMTWNNWEAGEPNNWAGTQDVAIMKTNKKWDDVNSAGSTMRFVCVVPKRDPVLCGDLLQGQCQQLLSKNAAMCNEHKRFASQFCTKTCGLCE